MQEVDIIADDTLADFDELGALDTVAAHNDQFTCLLRGHAVEVIQAVVLQLGDDLFAASDALAVVVVRPHDVRCIIHIYRAFLHHRADQLTRLVEECSIVVVVVEGVNQLAVVRLIQIGRLLEEASDNLLYFCSQVLIQLLEVVRVLRLFTVQDRQVLGERVN